MLNINRPHISVSILSAFKARGKMHILSQYISLYNHDLVCKYRWVDGGCEQMVVGGW